MEQPTYHKGISIGMFFFDLIRTIRETFAALYDGRRTSNRPIADTYRRFAEKWGSQKVLFELCQSTLEIEKVTQMYVTTVLNYLSYLKDKAIAEKAQDDLDEQIRKAKR